MTKGRVTVNGGRLEEGRAGTMHRRRWGASGIGASRQTGGAGLEAKLLQQSDG